METGINMRQFDPRERGADEIYADDGRNSDGKDHGGDWGHHSDGDGHADVAFDKGVQADWDKAIKSW